MKTIIVMALAALTAAQDKTSHFPVRKGYLWTYKGGQKLQAGHPVEITVPGEGKIKAFPLEGFEKEPAYIVESENGVKLIATRRVGFAAVESLVVIADLRWAGPETWTYATKAG